MPQRHYASRGRAACSALCEKAQLSWRHITKLRWLRRQCQRELEQHLSSGPYEDINIKPQGLSNLEITDLYIREADLTELCLQLCDDALLHVDGGLAVSL